jgi:hypothetical protein
MAVFSYVGGNVSMATGSYGNIAIRKGAQVAVPNTITTSARSFIEGTPASGLFDPVDRSLLYSRISHGSGYNATKINFNTTEPYNSGAYSTSSYYTPYNTVFQDLDYSQYNTESPLGEYWAHAQGYINGEFGTAIAVDKNRNAWVVGSTDYCSSTITSITASLTTVGSFTNNTTTPTSGTNDSGYFFPWTLPFNQNIFGLNDNNIVVQSNSWISFQPLVNNTTTTFIGTSPGWANIQIGAGEASCQRLYWGTFGIVGNRTFRIRFEGTNATTGTLGSPNMVWEFILYESNPNIFDIQIGAWTPPATNASGITDGSTYFGTFTPAANTGWRFNTGNVTDGASGNNITLVKYSNKGRFQQDKDFFPYTATDDLVVLSIGRNGSDVGEAIKVGNDGRIYILYTSNSQGYVSGVASNDIGIIKLDPDYLYKTSNAANAVVWNKTFGTTSNDSAQSFDIDTNDNLYITGFTVGSGQGNNDVVAIKVDKTGRVVWKKTYGGSTGGDLGNAIKISPDGNHLYIWGYSASTPLISSTDISSTDWFLLKVNSSDGVIVWQKHFNIGATTAGQVFENSVDVDPDGNVYVNGFGAASPQSYFVAKLDSSGNFKWSRNVGALTVQPDAGTSIKYKKGFIYAAGQDTSTTNNGERVGLGVTKIDANSGQIISNYVIGGVFSEFAYAIDIDDYNDIYATGVVYTTMVGLESASGANAFTTKFILDTPLGGFTISGDAGVWNSTKNVFKYTTSKEYFTASSIVFQNDLFATGQQSIFVETTLPSLINQSAGTFEVITRLSSYTAANQLITRSGTYTINNQISLRSGLVSLPSYSNLKSTFKPAAGSGTISLSGTAVIGIPKLIYNYTGSGTINASNQASAKVTFKPAELITLTNSDVQGFISASVPSGTGLSIDLETVTGSGSGAVVSYFSTNNKITFIEVISSGNNYRKGDVLRLPVGSNPTIILGVTTLFTFAGQSSIKTVKSNFNGSGSITGASGGIPYTTSQYNRVTNNLANASYYDVADLTLTSNTSVPNPLTGLTGDTAVFNGVNLVADSGYFTPVSNTGTLAANTVVVMSIFAKANTWDKFVLLGYNSKFGPSASLPNFEVRYNLTSGTASNLQATSIPLDYGIIPYTNGWYRCWFKVYLRSASSQSTLPGWFQVRFSGGSVANSSIYFYGVQLQRDVLTSYLENTTTSILTTTAYVQDNNSVTFDPAAGSGTISISNQASAKVIFKANDGTGLFNISGTAVISIPKLIYNYTGSGTISLSGTAVESQTDRPAAGSGTISISNQASARVIFDTVDGTGLFAFTNGYSNLKATRSYLKSSSNLLTFSEQFNDASWAKGDGAVSANIITAPDGTTTADEFIENTAPNAYHFFNQFITKPASSIPYTFSIFVKSKGGRRVGLRIESGGAGVIGEFNPVTGTITVGAATYNSGFSNVSSSIVKYPNDWYRITLTATSNTSTSLFIQLYLVSNTTNSSVYTGDGVSGVFIWGSKLETGSIATPYIADSGVTLTDNIININGTADIRVPIKFSGSGTFTETGAASQATARVAFIPINTIILYNTNAITKLAMQYAGKSPTTPFGGLDIVFEELEANAPPQQFKYTGSASAPTTVNVSSTGILQISGTGSYTSTEKWVGSGSISLSGQHGVNVFKPNWIASGTIDASNQASAKVAFKPADGTGLFAFTNGYTNLKATSILVGSGTATFSGTAGTKSINKHIGASPIAYYDPSEIVFGEGDIFYATQFKITSQSQYAASSKLQTTGSLFAGSGSSAKVTFKPADGTGLFTFTNAAVQKQTNIALAGSGTITLSGAATTILKSLAIWSSSGSVTLSGSVVQNRTSILPAGSGTIITSNLASAKVTFKPADSTGLFSVSGSVAQKQTNTTTSSGTITLSGAATTPLLAKYSGSGSVTLSGSGVENQTDRPTAGSGTINISNQASAKVTFRPVDGTGLFTFTNAAGQKHIDIASGSGSISSLSGGAERVAFKSADGTGLFAFTNGYTNLKATSVLVGSGTATISGAAGIKAPNRHIGASPIAYYDPSEIVFGEGDIFYASELKITSFQSQYRFIQGAVSYQSSGSLFALGGASQSTRFKPADGTGLFTISGQLGNNIFKPNWITSGTINASNQASAAVSFKAVDGTGLFGISGSLIENKTSIIPAGSGTYNISGNASTSFTKTGSTTRITGGALTNASIQQFAGAFVNTSSSGLTSILSQTGSGSGAVVYVNVTADETLAGSTGNSYIKSLYLYNSGGSGYKQGDLIYTATPSFRNIFNQAGSVVYLPVNLDDLNFTPYGSTLVPVGTANGLSGTFKAPAGSGTITLSGAYSNLKSVDAWNGSGSVTLSGAAGQKHIDIASGSGTITISGAAVLPLLAKYSGSGSATISGSLVESQTDRTSGSGTITLSGAYSNFAAASAWNGSGSVTLSGAAGQKHIDIASGSGSISSLSGGAERVAFKPADGTGLFAFSGQLGNNIFKPNWITSGTISISQQASAAVSFKALDGTGLFTFTNSAVPKQTNIALAGSGTITLSGAAVLPLFAKYFGSGLLTLSGSLVERETNRTSGSGTINASNQASAAVSFKPAGGTGLFTFTNGYSNLKATNISIDGSGSLFSSGFFSNLKVTFRSPGTGLFTLSGQHGDNVFKPNWITSGTISISQQASAAVSFKAVDGTGLFTFSNAAVLKKTNISIDGSGSLFSSGFFSNLKVTFKEVSVTGLFSVSGSAVERETNRPAAGSGTINIGQQASAAVSFKPAGGTGLFTFTNGYTNLKATDAWVGSGSATLSGSVVEKQRQVALGSGSATLSGTATERQTDRPIAGSGTISISNQASAAVLFRPVDGTGLFTFTNGYSNLKATDAWLGSGSVTIDSTSTAKVVWVPSAGTGLFDITGTAGIKLRDWIFVSPIVEFDPYELIINDNFVVTDIIKLYQRWNATNNVEGSSGVSSTNIHQSSGSLFADSTASAIVTFNPTEGDPFFVVSGSAIDSHTEVAVASGTATISGFVAQSQTNLPAAGSGTISISEQASAKVTFKPADGTGLFAFSGSLVESRTEVAIGSGTINVSNQASGAVSFKATDGTGLFTFAGSVVEKQTDITSGSGTIITSNLASARVTFKPADGTGLFTFTGSVVEKQTEVAIGSGTVVISGNAIVPTLIKYSGSGTATISGTAVESQTDRPAAGSGTINASNQASAKVTFKPADGTGLFTFTGSVVEKQTEVAIGSGTISISNQASAKVTFKPADGSGSITLSGISREKHIDITSGSGTISISEQASAKVTFKPADGTGLFTFSGQLGNNIFKPNWITSGTINVSNQASAAVSFKATDGTGLFSVSGSVVQSQTNKTFGFGTISISNQASATVTFKPAGGTGLFTFSGQLGNNIFKPNWITSGTISISNQSSAAVSFKTIDGTGLFTFSGSVVQSQINRTSGSGTISISNQASAKVTFKPAEGTGLFGISGSLVEKRISILPSGSGTISISNQASAKVTFKAVDGTGLFIFFNAAVAKQINVLIGSGTINASNQASAKVTFKPAGGTGLFSVSGSAVERQTDRPAAGSGTIGISNQSSAVVSVNTSDGTGLFTFTNGYSNFKASSAWLGSGTINASDQASAKVTFKPAEGTGLFTISGNSNIVVQSNYTGSGIQLFSYIINVVVYTTSKLPPFSGVTFVSGDSSNSTQYSNVGSGTINASDQASAKVTFSASSSTALFQISGEAIIKVPNYRGSGIINVGNQASAKVTFKPAGGTGLFTFSDGYSNLKITDAWLGSGSLFSIGSSPETRTFTWQTEPREISYLFSGAAEYDKVTSYESTILLNISGSARVKTELPERIFATII